jgi:hypothetical protein
MLLLRPRCEPLEPAADRPAILAGTPSVGPLISAS